MDCPTNTSIILDNTPLECDEIVNVNCVYTTSAIAFLNLPSNSSQKQVNDAMVLTLINAFTTITALTARVTALENQ